MNGHRYFNSWFSRLCWEVSAKCVADRYHYNEWFRYYFWKWNADVSKALKARLNWKKKDIGSFSNVVLCQRNTSHYTTKLSLLQAKQHLVLRKWQSNVFLTLRTAFVSNSVLKFQLIIDTHWLNLILPWANNINLPQGNCAQFSYLTLEGLLLLLQF